MPFLAFIDDIRLVGVDEIGATSMDEQSSSQWINKIASDNAAAFGVSLGNAVSMNLASLDSISVTVPSSFSPMKTYPFDCSEYLIKRHFFPLGPSFPYLWEFSWIYAADPQGLKMLKSGLCFVHNS
ncbi:uncharacterized protein G2W53_036952 [Senna tora]|uniref:Uncharacterized protein n=1 Tax=Senna tora TaxID=362788 RepID=A0A834T5N3_9FABA|nr:uncharacterized protein G2W53_036952 [Senna tora]